MGLHSYEDDWYGPSYATEEDKRVEELKDKLNSISSTLEKTQKELSTNERYLMKVSHNTFTKNLNLIRPLLRYRTIKPPTYRTPDDECRTIVFYHPNWAQMPVAQIVEYFLCGATVKEYYINPGYCHVLRGPVNENTNSNPN